MGRQRCLAPAGWFPTTPAVSSSFQLPDKEESSFYAGVESLDGELSPTIALKQSRVLSFATPDDLFGRMTPAYVAESQRKEGILDLRPVLFREPKSRGSTRSSRPRRWESWSTARASHVLRPPRQRRVCQVCPRSGICRSEELAAANPNLEFPPGALELKSSWKVISTSDDAGAYFTTRATLPLLKNDADPLGNNIVVIDPMQTREVDRRSRGAARGRHRGGPSRVHLGHIRARRQRAQSATVSDQRDHSR